MSERRNGNQKKEGLSLQTLAIAAFASATAALVTSRLWPGGAIYTAALTPVIVAIVSDLTRRPMESELVKRPVRRISEVRAVRREATLARGTVVERDRIDPPEEGGNGVGPVRVYGREEQSRFRLRQIHWRIVLWTAALAFVIAAAVLTIPEVIAGDAVSGKRDTTFFGGGADERKADEQPETPQSPEQDPRNPGPTPDQPGGAPPGDRPSPPEGGDSGSPPRQQPPSQEPAQPPGQEPAPGGEGLPPPPP